MLRSWPWVCPYTSEMAWVSTFRQSLVDARELLPSFQGRTLRALVSNTLEGDAVRIVLANPYGSKDITVRYASVEGHALTFGGIPSALLKPETELRSDPLPLALSGSEKLDVRVGFGDEDKPVSGQYGLLPTFLSIGQDAAGDVLPPESFTTVKSAPCLKAVEVRSETGASIIAIGDSLTHQSRWPSIVGTRLSGISVLNLGISGNQLLGNGPILYYGPPLRERFVPETLGLENVRLVFFEAGLNDFILNPGTTAKDIISGYETVGTFCADRGWPMVPGTLPPIGGSKLHTPEIEVKRQEVNEWIRKKDVFLDYDVLLGDPGRPHILDARYDKGDALHMNQAGAERVAEAVLGMLLDAYSNLSKD